MSKTSIYTLLVGIGLSVIILFFHISPMTPIAAAIGYYLTIACGCYIIPLIIGWVASGFKGINDPWFYKSAWILQFFMIFSLYGTIASTY